MMAFIENVTLLYSTFQLILDGCISITFGSKCLCSCVQIELLTKGFFYMAAVIFFPSFSDFIRTCLILARKLPRPNLQRYRSKKAKPESVMPLVETLILTVPVSLLQSQHFFYSFRKLEWHITGFLREPIFVMLLEHIWYLKWIINYHILVSFDSHFTKKSVLHSHFHCNNNVINMLCSQNSFLEIKKNLLLLALTENNTFYFCSTFFILS